MAPEFGAIFRASVRAPQPATAQLAGWGAWILGRFLAPDPGPLFSARMQPMTSSRADPSPSVGPAVGAHTARMRPPQPPQRRIIRKLQFMSAIFVAGTLQSQGFFGRVPVGGISAEFRAHRGPNFIRQSAGRHPPKRVHLENEYILTADLRVSLGSGVSFCYSVHRSPDLNTFFEARVDPKRCGPSDRTPPLGVSAHKAR